MFVFLHRIPWASTVLGVCSGQHQVATFRTLRYLPFRHAFRGEKKRGEIEAKWEGELRLMMPGSENSFKRIAKRNCTATSSFKGIRRHACLSIIPLFLFFFRLLFCTRDPTGMVGLGHPERQCDSQFYGKAGTRLQRAQPNKINENQG